MDALWNLEDKWQISTQEAVLLLACTCSAFLALGLCIAAAIKKGARRKQLVGQEPTEAASERLECLEPPPSHGSIKRVLIGQEPSEAESKGLRLYEPQPGRSSIKRVLIEQEPSKVESEGLRQAGRSSIKRELMDSVRWSHASRWEESSCRKSGKERTKVPLLIRREGEADVGWQSHNSTSPVWQRPILMGEKCELPRFSGLILYDERGRLLHHSDMETNHQELSAMVVGTTLRDLL
ncbi:hypothetical protein NMG60_11003248 [Bertholletia excelsa]